MNVPKYVETAIRLLEAANFEVYIVGGAVRDFLLGKIPSDFDLSTNATPTEIKNVFKDFFIIDTGIKYGTVSIMIGGKLLQITTYRSEGEYTDFRRPDDLHFIKNIEDDLKRRDFTINSICYNKDYLDLNDGRGDLEKKIIRAIGDPVARFREDPLRILRALRFSSTLGFTIEEGTNRALIENFNLLENISKERINNEFSKLILGKNLVSVLVEYKTYLEKYVLDFKIAENFKILPKLKQILSLRLATISLDLEPNELRTKFKTLKYPKQVIKEIISIVGIYNLDLYPDSKYLLKLLKKIDYKSLVYLVDIKEEIQRIKKENRAEIKLIRKILKGLEFKYLRVENLEINGNDLIELGFSEGRRIKVILNKLLDDCLDGLPNEKAVLKNKAKEYLQLGCG